MQAGGPLTRLFWEWKCSLFNCRATTHSDLVLRAKEKGIQYKVIHNASIMNAVGCTGLQVPYPGFSTYILSCGIWCKSWLISNTTHSMPWSKVHMSHAMFQAVFFKISWIYDCQSSCPFKQILVYPSPGQLFTFKLHSGIMLFCTHDSILV